MWRWCCKRGLVINMELGLDCVQHFTEMKMLTGNWYLCSVGVQVILVVDI